MDHDSTFQDLHITNLHEQGCDLASTCKRLASFNGLEWVCHNDRIRIAGG